MITKNFSMLILIMSIFILFGISLTACQTATPSPTAISTPMIVSPSSTPDTSPSVPAPVTATELGITDPTSMPQVTSTELGITDPTTPLATTFAGVEKKVTREANGTYSVQATSYAEGADKKSFSTSQEKYIIDKNSFSLTEDIPVVTATDSQGNKVTLLYDKSTGLFTKEFTNLSGDIENPTDFPYEARIAMMQSIRLQHADPFTERSKKPLLYQSEKTADGSRITVFRTDNIDGNQSKKTGYWLRVIMPNGSYYYVNPTDVNDIDRRKLVMCTYAKAATNPTGGQNDKYDGVVRNMLIKYVLTDTRIYWPVLQADQSYFKNLEVPPPLPSGNSDDLNYLLGLFNPQDVLNLPGLPFKDVDTFFKNPNDTPNTTPMTEIANWNNGVQTPSGINSNIENAILPCILR